MEQIFKCFDWEIILPHIVWVWMNWTSPECEWVQVYTFEWVWTPLDTSWMWLRVCEWVWTPPECNLLHVNASEWWKHPINTIECKQPPFEWVLNTPECNQVPMNGFEWALKRGECAPKSPKFIRPFKLSVLSIGINLQRIMFCFNGNNNLVQHFFFHVEVKVIQCWPSEFILYLGHGLVRNFTDSPDGKLGISNFYRSK